MMIDDNQEITDLIAPRLESRGFSVDVFNDPVDAILSFKAGKYDVVLLDIRMPRMDGLRVFRELRRLDQRIKVCVFSSLPLSKDEVTRMSKESDVLVIEKPTTMDALVERINSILGP